MLQAADEWCRPEAQVGSRNERVMVFRFLSAGLIYWWRDINRSFRLERYVSYVVQLYYQLDYDGNRVESSIRLVLMPFTRELRHVVG